MRVSAKSRSPLVRQMTGEDGLHQRIAGLDAGDHVPDLLVDLLDWNAFVRRRLRDCRISIEHIRAGGGRRGTEDIWYNLKQEELQ